MTENEVIKTLTFSEAEKKIFPMLVPVYETAIKALEEVQQYREIGTLEECRAAVEVDNETTRIIDGITECCGYDFGTDAFQVELSKYCPVCGRKIERSRM